MHHLIRPHKFEYGDFCSFGVTETAAVAAAAEAGTAATAATAAAAAGGSWLATAGTVAELAGAGIGAFGAINQGKASSASAKYNSQVALNNAEIQKQNAAFASQEGATQVAEQQQKTRAAAGAIRASQAASGIDGNSGSAVDVQSSAAETGQLNAINIRADAVRKAYGYQTAAASDEAQSGLDKSEAENDSTAGIISSGTTALGGAGNAALGYANYLQKGGL